MAYLIIAIILFIVADVLIRFSLKKAKENKEKKERTSALKEGLKVDFSQEAKTLKRVEVENPKARILCVDDEPVILDSFRKILVIDGYSVDTVERGNEAIRLIRTNHYDFVYVDLKMPEMDGVEVTKTVKHVRPDIDVIIITGYASVETAVETMKFGALDYVEKPFTEDELLEFTKNCLIKRKDRIKKELGPIVHIAQISDFENRDIDKFSIPGGVFISEGHCWLSLNEDGTAKIGVDDFAKKMIGRIDDIDKPNLGRKITRGEALFSLKQGNRTVPFFAPVSGKILKINSHLLDNLDLLEISCYDKSWICIIDTDDIDAEVKDLKIGKSAVSFFQDEIKGCKSHFKSLREAKSRDKDLAEHNGYCLGKIEKLSDREWDKTIQKFFKK